MLQRLRKWMHIKKALNLILDHKDPIDYGFTLDEEDAAIDKFNELAAIRGWDIRQGKCPRSQMPNPPWTDEGNLDCARCRDCGRTVHDWYTDDTTFAKVIGSNNGVWCWDCFAERAWKKGIITECQVTAIRL